MFREELISMLMLIFRLMLTVKNLFTQAEEEEPNPGVDD